MVSYLNCQTKVEDAVLDSVLKCFESFACNVAESVDIQVDLKVVFTLQRLHSIYSLGKKKNMNTTYSNLDQSPQVI